MTQIIMICADRLIMQWYLHKMIAQIEHPTLRRPPGMGRKYPAALRALREHLLFPSIGFQLFFLSLRVFLIEFYNKNYADTR